MMQSKNLYQPIIIIGAPRSGTNILRDVMCRLPGVGTWPCDEINYIWRHGNARYPADVFPPEFATEPVKYYIRQQFNSLYHCNKSFSYIVEKTCANSLRVGFVNQVIPNAKFIYIVRNGMDVVASAKKRWKSQLDFKYILRKSRYVPISDMPYYAGKYLLNRIYKIFDKDKRLAYWGPRLKGMNDLSSCYSLTEICAMQWRECVDLADSDLSHIASDRVHRLYYEDFVKQPRHELRRIADFLQIGVSQEELNTLTTDVLTDSVGKSGQDLNTEERKLLLPILDEAMRKHGYL